jgi:hypothetical protein
MLRICVYMHSRFVENHPIQILEDGPLIFEGVLSHNKEKSFLQVVEQIKSETTNFQLAFPLPVVAFAPTSWVL